MWRETHCMYTQLSSENGLPGLFLYAAALFFCIRPANRIYKSTRNRPETADIAAMSYAILLSLVGFAATALFSSVAYHMFFPTLAGLSTAFARAVETMPDHIGTWLAWGFCRLVSERFLEARQAFERALEGKVWEALTLNGLIYSSASHFNPAIAIDALAAGAVAAGLCGKGPAVTAVVPNGKVEEVKAALAMYEGEILQAKVNREKAKVL